MKPPPSIKPLEHTAKKLNFESKGKSVLLLIQLCENSSALPGWQGWDLRRCTLEPNPELFKGVSGFNLEQTTTGVTRFTTHEQGTKMGPRTLSLQSHAAPDREGERPAGRRGSYLGRKG